MYSDVYASTLTISTFLILLVIFFFNTIRIIFDRGIVERYQFLAVDRPYHWSVHYYYYYPRSRLVSFRRVDPNLRTRVQRNPINRIPQKRKNVSDSVTRLISNSASRFGGVHSVRDSVTRHPAGTARLDYSSYLVDSQSGIGQRSGAVYVTFYNLSTSSP